MSPVDTYISSHAFLGRVEGVHIWLLQGAAPDSEADSPSVDRAAGELLSIWQDLIEWRSQPGVTDEMVAMFDAEIEHHRLLQRLRRAAADLVDRQPEGGATKRLKALQRSLDAAIAGRPLPRKASAKDIDLDGYQRAADQFRGTLEPDKAV